MSTQPLLQRLLEYHPRWSPTMYKFTLGGAVVLALVIPLALVSVPFIEFFNGMAAQPKMRTQMPYGRVWGEQRLGTFEPVAGTIPRDYYPYEFDGLENSIEAAQEVGNQLGNPVPMSMAALRRGQRLYNVYCITCHGARGEGDGPVIGANRMPAPPSLHTDQAVGYKDGTIYHVITKGMGKMPPYADKLDPYERWMVVKYVRALQRSMAPRPEDLQP